MQVRKTVISFHEFSSPPTISPYCTETERKCVITKEVLPGNGAKAQNKEGGYECGEEMAILSFACLVLQYVQNNKIKLE